MGGNSRFLTVSIITPPLLTLNMRETESMKSGVKINSPIICIKHRYVCQMGIQACPECVGCWR
jgi:hypothetical protein